MIDLKDLRLLKLTEIDGMLKDHLPCILYRKDENTFRTVCITEDDMIVCPTIIKSTTEYWCKEKSMYVRINRPFKSFA
jgi:hypothetical protein